jgi:TRAP-type C4-dicarboxylate transport system substrate-binding protein
LKIWNSLSQSDRDIVEKAAADAFSKYLGIALTSEQSYLSTMEKKHGVKITYPDLKPFEKAVEPVYTKFFEKNPSLKSTVEKARGVQ